MPITWQNVTGPRLADAALPLGQSQQSISDGFDRLSKQLADAQAVAQNQQDQDMQAKVVAFKEALANAATPDQVAAIQAQHDNMLAGVQAKFREPVVNAANDRLAAVYQQTKAAQDFQDSQAAVANRATVGKAYEQALKGDKEGALQTLAPLNGVLPDYTTHVANIVGEDQKLRKFNDDLLSSQVKRATEISNAVSQAQQVENQGREVDAKVVEKAGDSLGKTVERLGQVRGNIVGSTEGTKALEAGIASAFANDKDKVATMTRLAADALSRNPKFQTLPTDVVLQTVIKHASDFGTGKYNPSDLFATSNITNDLNSLLDPKQNPEVARRVLENETSRLMLEEQVKRQKAQQETATNRLSAPSTVNDRLAAAAAAAKTGTLPTVPPAGSTAPAPTGEPGTAPGIKIPTTVQDKREQDAAYQIFKSEYQGDPAKVKADIDQVTQAIKQAKDGTVKGILQGRLNQLNLALQVGANTPGAGNPPPQVIPPAGSPPPPLDVPAPAAAPATVPAPAVAAPAVAASPAQPVGVAAFGMPSPEQARAASAALQAQRDAAAKAAADAQAKVVAQLQARAEAALKQKDLKALSSLQTSTGYGALDRALRSRIYQALN